MGKMEMTVDFRVIEWEKLEVNADFRVIEWDMNGKKWK